MACACLCCAMSLGEHSRKLARAGAGSAAAPRRGLGPPPPWFRGRLCHGLAVVTNPELVLVVTVEPRVAAGGGPGGSGLGAVGSVGQRSAGRSFPKILPRPTPVDSRAPQAGGHQATGRVRALAPGASPLPRWHVFVCCPVPRVSVLQFERGSVAGEALLDQGEGLHVTAGCAGGPTAAGLGVTGLSAVLPVGAAWSGLDMGCHASAGSTEEARAPPSRCCDGQ